MVEKFDEFMDDVEKDIRQEQLKKMWIKYGTYAAAGFAGILVLATGFTIYSNQQDANLQLTAEKYAKAQSLAASGDIARALGVYERITISDSATYGTLAQLARTRHMTAKGGDDFQKAQTMLLDMSKNSKVDILFRDFALLTYVKNEVERINIPSKEVHLDAATKTKLLALATQIDAIAGPNGTWRLSALDTKGLIYYLARDFAKASEVFVQIAQNKNCPKGLLARADLMSQFILKQMSRA
jgi:hypothetical protein